MKQSEQSSPNVRRDGPLGGIRVIDMTRAFGGPLATMILAEMGADVIKIEEPTTGDESRTFSPMLKGGVSSYFSSLNRSKRSVALNLKAAQARDIVLQLAAKSHVFVENFTPGVAGRLGLAYEDVKKVRPDIIYCSISGFGQDGPYRERKGYDPVLQAMGGLMGVTGEKGGGPIKSMVPIADISVGHMTAMALLGALFNHARRGTGQYIDMSMLDVMVSMQTTVGTAYLNTGIVPTRSGTENPARTPSAAFECSDGVYIQLVPNQRQWKDFCTIIGGPELVDDPRFADNLSRVANQDALYPIVRALMRKQPSKYWDDAFVKAGIPAGPINELDALFADPQVIARKMALQFEDDRAGTVRGIDLPFRFSDTPVYMRSRPPHLGEHTDEVLATLIDMPATQIAALRSQTVL
ncbi:CaiB/BaiF CoA-transferase family protein [Bradyrhizobium sp. LHD-71]|uniref:CaiB/BaiF CoA transferase family protein n=1 Tax=Bradyrhizobium sp. LHD-71 TaxID=3072141 RepID=UPI00280FFE5D|nr:CaiB/BaiF CoA-transferase family protein [Bradyrhizobium sp. LHD-71]MDQ8728192.1 CaiB/BaiF CoA-transferase family protein [Bradyrhizobium sp. LHD-71]